MRFKNVRLNKSKEMFSRFLFVKYGKKSFEKSYWRDIYSYYSL